MNTPSTLGDNWQWRALPGSFDQELAERLYQEMRTYQRLPKKPVRKAGKRVQGAADPARLSR